MELDDTHLIQQQCLFPEIMTRDDSCLAIETENDAI